MKVEWSAVVGGDRCGCGCIEQDLGADAPERLKKSRRKPAGGSRYHLTYARSGGGRTTVSDRDAVLAARLAGAELLRLELRAFGGLMEWRPRCVE